MQHNEFFMNFITTLIVLKYVLYNYITTSNSCNVCIDHYREILLSIMLLLSYRAEHALSFNDCL